MTMGINARDLSDDDLLRELAHLKQKADDIESGGTADQQANHRRRTAELEEEFLRRNPPGASGASDDPGSPDGNQPGDADSGPSGGPDDAAPAGPNDGPLDDQPETEPQEQRPESEQPSDAPTSDPARPANPA